MAGGVVTSGTISITWAVVDEEAVEPHHRYDWSFKAEPPIPDDLAEEILREVAARI